jgi:pyruvate carboxylase
MPYRTKQAHENSLTFVSYADVVKAGVSWMNMINKAGATVQPSVASVQSAMTGTRSSSD